MGTGTQQHWTGREPWWWEARGARAGRTGGLAAVRPGSATDPRLTHSFPSPRWSVSCPPPALWPPAPTPPMLHFSFLHFLPAPLCSGSFCKGLEYLFNTQRASQQFTSIHSKQLYNYPPLTEAGPGTERSSDFPRVTSQWAAKIEFKARMCVLGSVFAASQLSWEVSCSQGILSPKQWCLIEGFPQTKDPEGQCEWWEPGPLSSSWERERAASLPGAPWEPPPGRLLAAREAPLAETPGKPFPARIAYWIQDLFLFSFLNLCLPCFSCWHWYNFFWKCYNHWSMAIVWKMFSL